jgi:hypothetical protein
MMKEEKKEPIPANKNYQAGLNDESGNEDQDSEYAESSEDSPNVSGNKKGRDLNKPRHGGVLNGRNKTAVNAQSAIAQAG